MQSARAGDRQALDRLLRNHYDRLYALCRRLMGQDADALDACQEALITIARRLDRFDGRSSFATWAYRVTTNTCFDELRRGQRRPMAVPPPETASTSDVGEGAVNRVDVDTALGRLPIEYRAAVVLRDLCGLAYDDIAEVLDVPIGTVRSRIARGRSQLVPLLSPGDQGNRERPFDRPTAAP
ncbi:MAG: putative polymerase subfamily sigma factor [Acidimicrobiales bacterium]|nr:putative polymerase subfamily sigma factor [Acidimicrobiales bacterium]